MIINLFLYSYSMSKQSNHAIVSLVQHRVALQAVVSLPAFRVAIHTAAAFSALS